MTLTRLEKILDDSARLVTESTKMTRTHH